VTTLFEIRATHAMYHAGQIRPVDIVRERYGAVPFERKRPASLD
jgi:hypothetical protein